MSSLSPDRRDEIRAGAIGALLDLPEAIGRYVVRGELGRGGMGVVYDAIDPQLKRPVAIKVINPVLLRDRPDAAALEERFEREMCSVSPVFDANVVTILDAGLARLGGTRAAYYVMERVVGESLEDRLRRRGALSRHEALGVASGVARGLAALHARGLVHRDVKPSNVLLPIGEDGQLVAKVSDFGLVHLIRDPRHPAPNDSEPVIAGSAHGLAPEQIHAESIDGRADIFALGALLIRVFTGDEPFAASSLRDRLHRIEWDRPDGLDALPTDVRALAERLLAKSPGERPSTAEEVVRELDALRGPRRTTLRTWAARVVAVAGALTVAWLGASEWQATRIDESIRSELARHRSVVEAQLERAGFLAAAHVESTRAAPLPADERRAAHDRLEGVVNRLAHERAQHANRLAELEADRRFPTTEALTTLLDRPSDSLASAPRRAVEDPGHHLTDAAAAMIAQQVELLDREFGLTVEVRLHPDVELQNDGARQSEDHALAGRRLRFTLDPDRSAGRIETSASLEAILSDALLGALLREQILPLAERGEAAFGIELAFRVIREELRRARRDGETIEATAPDDFAGGGARTARMPEAEGLPGPLPDHERALFGAAPTVLEAWTTYLQWLDAETHDAHVALFTPASRALVEAWPASRPYWRGMRRRDPLPTLATLERDDVALLYSSDDPTFAPRFFVRSDAGWQIDLVAGNAHLIHIAGGEDTWTFRGVRETPLALFEDALIVDRGLIRLAGHQSDRP